MESAWTAMIWGPAVGTVVLTIAAPFYWQGIAVADLPLFALLAALGTGAQLCLIRSFSITEASVVAPFGYVGIVLATGWGIVLYDEFPDALTLLGAAVIVAAGLYVWHRETRVKR